MQDHSNTLRSGSRFSKNPIIPLGCNVLKMSRFHKEEKVQVLLSLVEPTRAEAGDVFYDIAGMTVVSITSLLRILGGKL
jgi:hypothetical protein